MKERKPFLTKEQKERMTAEKAEFDEEAKHHFCIRCTSHVVTSRVLIEVSTKLGVIPSPDYWLCQDCVRGLSRYIDEIRREQREADRPIREAEQAERKRVLDARLSEDRARLDADRAASGLPPLQPTTKPRLKRKTDRNKERKE